MRFNVIAMQVASRTRLLWSNVVPYLSLLRLTRSGPCQSAVWCFATSSLASNHLSRAGFQDEHLMNCGQNVSKS